MKAVISRYAHSEAIFAWELVNEPRCGADAVRNLPSSGTCTADTLTSWMDEMSKFIKSIDPWHLVTTGSEGEFNFPGNTDGFYSAADGDDFYAQLRLSAIDYNTFHLYPGMCHHVDILV